MPANAALTKSVGDRLRFSGLDKGHLREVADTMAQLQASGLNIHDVFPNGIVAPDSVIAHAQISAEKLDLLKQLLVNPRIGGISVFPLGIINPEQFRINVTIR